MKSFLLTLSLASALAFAAVSCGNNSQPTEQKVTLDQLTKVYDDDADPAKQIDDAIAAAKAEGKFVICQVGGNWCRWCLMFAEFITADEEIAQLVSENFIYSHINVRYKDAETGKNSVYTEAMAKLGNPMRFGFPVLVVLDADGNVLHTQDSSFLEEGEGYDKAKVMRFFKAWTPSAVTR